MPDELENHTLRLLCEMREEMRSGFEEMRGGFKNVYSRLDQLDVATSKLTWMKCAFGLEPDHQGL